MMIDNFNFKVQEKQVPPAAWSGPEKNSHSPEQLEPAPHEQEHYSAVQGEGQGAQGALVGSTVE